MPEPQQCDAAESHTDDSDEQSEHQDDARSEVHAGTHWRERGPHGSHSSPDEADDEGAERPRYLRAVLVREHQ